MNATRTNRKPRPKLNDYDLMAKGEFKWVCRACNIGFHHPEAMDPTGTVKGFASPCCDQHYCDAESVREGRPCARDCCPELDPKDKKDFGYDGD